MHTSLFFYFSTAAMTFIPITSPNILSSFDVHQNFANVIGVFYKLSEYPCKKEITIYNEQGETVNIIFWDATVSVNPADFRMMNDKIIVVTTTTVKERDGILHLIDTKGSKVYLDPDISEAHKLRQSLSQKGPVISKKRIMDISNVQTIDYI